MKKVEVITRAMPINWTPSVNDIDLSDRFQRRDKSCSLSMAVSKVRKGSVITPPIFYVKSSRLNSYTKISVKDRLPRWVPDESIMNCTDCQIEFTFLNRRHHCRLCGQIFCDACSNPKVGISGFPAPVRVCVQCINSKTTSFQPKSILLNQKERRTRWVPDVQRESCFTCNKIFGILNLRHHCRACGELFCATCSQYSIKLSTYTTPQRVCIKCYTKSFEVSDLKKKTRKNSAT